MDIFFKMLLWSIIIYVFYCGLLFLAQRQIIFPHYLVDAPAETISHIPRMEKIWLNTSSGKVESWFIPAGHAETPCPTVIFAHGNAEVIDFWPDQLMTFTHLGMNLLLVEYPGYGRSQGKPSQNAITETFLMAYDALISRKDVDPSRIILVGRSLGSGAVCQLALKRQSAALLLMSGFTSVRSFTNQYFIPSFLCRDPFDNLAVVGSYPNPILIVHGTKDKTIPYSHGKTLAQAAKNGKLITYECGHNDCPPQWDVFWKDIEAFFRQAGIL